MILREIELNNIRSHKVASVKFYNGINVITGNTGSGKSSIFMAIQYALFGKIGEGREEGKLLLRRGAARGWVALKFSDVGTEYYIKRGLKRLKDSVRNDDEENEIRKDGKKIDLQNRAADLNNFILKLLGIESINPLKTFEAITYIKQDELKDLIFESGQAKQEYLDQLLQLNKYADTYEKLKEVNSKIEKEVDLLGTELSSSGDEEEAIRIESRIGQLNALNAEAERRITELKNTLENNKIKLRQIESEIQFYRDKKNESTRLNAERSQRITQLAGFEKQLLAIDSDIKSKLEKVKEIDHSAVLALKKEKHEKEGILVTVDIELKSAYETLYACETDLKVELSRLERINKEIKRIESENTTLRNEENTLKKLLELKSAELSAEEINGRVLQLKQCIEEIKSEEADALRNGRCAICRENITDIIHIKNEYTRKVKRYEELITSLSTEQNKKITGKSRQELQRDYDLLTLHISENAAHLRIYEDESKENSLNKLNERIIALRKNYDAISNKKNYIEQELSALNNKLLEIEKIEVDIKNIDVLKDRSAYLRIESQKASEEIATITEKINKLGFDAIELEAKETELKHLNITISQISAGVASANSEFHTRESEIEENKEKLGVLKTKLEKRENMRRELDKKSKFLSLMENLRKDIRDIREYVRNKFINDFRSLFQSKFLEIRNENDYSIDIDNNYNVKVAAGGEVLDAKTLSGGEKTSVALAYRLALSSIASMLGGISKNECLLMDEPTTGLDREDINALSTCITKITDIVQIIIVTHEDIMKNIADNLISVAKVSGESIISSSKA